MLQLKQTVLNYCMESLENILGLMTESYLHFRARLNSPFQENLGMTLYDLMLLPIIIAAAIAICISNLLLLTVQMLMKLAVLLKHIAAWAWNALCTLCPWADVVKVITSPYRKLRSFVWKKDGDSHPDSTLAYSEMPGELDKNAKFLRDIHTEEQFVEVRKYL